MNKKNNCRPCIKTSIGGQALLEGIMMRGPQKSAMAVRNPEGEIVIEDVEIKQKKRPKITKMPFIRGVFAFLDSLTIGYKALMRSAEISGLEEAEAELVKEKEEKKRAKANKQAENVEASADSIEAETTDINTEKPAKEKNSGALMGTVMIIGTLLGVLLAVGLFVALPNLVCSLILGEDPDPVLFAVISGAIKIVILISYMWLVSYMKDIKRTFMYHGAEHKTIFCYENGLELNVENVKKQSRFHPRCGTSFLFLTVFVSVVLMIVVGVLLRAWLPDEIKNSKLLYTIIRTGIAILLVPLMAGIGYELIKIAGKHDNAFTRIISAPGLLMQRITTKEPDDSMIECAIAAIKEVIPDDGSDKI